MNTFFYSPSIVLISDFDSSLNIYLRCLTHLKTIIGWYYHNLNRDNNSIGGLINQSENGIYSYYSYS